MAPEVFCGVPELPVQAYAINRMTNRGTPSTTSRRRQ
jgi:hypothetical protein